ncbi:hypothetical protein TsFJ059_008206 [Trichoderma semiorbis]|uniref:Heterokaryon incompatibility domain-containing protein n=1 Tax=Trichoderma semiorbis TaxID=1491008 RepID=A0A9P8KKU6_9HYPO|nr:hypothetical protein TsFJ059_008206 [Trichoderma semiorbis]
MRLINTKTLKLEEFSEGSIPPYAILSHTWGNDAEELSFREVENGIIDKPGVVVRNGTTDKLAVGSTKLRGCCQQAVEDGLGYAWIDTCCIDKTNLVELSEAINSMFRWYNRATVCYAYLSDVPSGDDPPKPGSKFRSSRWFQRGWTLQELLAPKHLRFYNTKWRYIGTKGTMCTVIMNITCVPRQFLLGISRLHTASVAQRMSWAAKRETKRAEDLAYCLLGIFGISMPMIYGEGGEQAFFRLQEQIMKTTRDDSILAWDLDDKFYASHPRDRDGGVLAPDPSHFANSGQIIARQHADNPLHSLDMVGGSLRIHLPLLTTASGGIFGLLNCGPALNPHKIVGIPLARATPVASNEYVRPRRVPSVLRTVAASRPPPELVHIKKDGQNDAFIRTNKKHWLYEDDLFAQIDLTLVEVEPTSCWDTQTNLISPLNSDVSSSLIFLRFRHAKAGSQDFVTILERSQLELDTDPQLATVICSTVTCSRNSPLQEVAEDLRLRLASPEATGKQSARNEVLQLRVKSEPAEGGIISIKPEAILFQADATVHTFENADLILDLKRLIRERREIISQRDGLRIRSEAHSDHVRLAGEERDKVERQIKELEGMKRRLVEQVEDSARELHYLGQEQTKLEERQDYLSNQMSLAYTHLDKLNDEDKYQVGYALSQEVVEDNDVEVIEHIVATISEATAMLIAASSKRDVDKVRRLLTIGVEPDGKDGQSGRTALSWASENGSESIVRLLLDTGKVDINSQDNNGRSPLQWASEKKFDDVARLLLANGAKMDCQRTLLAHERSVYSVALSHDSKLIVSGSWMAIKIWDTATGECYHTMQGHKNSVNSVAFSHDSKLIASGSDDCTIKVWDAATGECYQTLKGHAMKISSVAFSHDSHLIVSGSDDDTMMLWDSVTGQRLHVLYDQYSDHFSSVAFSHDSKYIVSGYDSGRAILWDSITGEVVQTLEAHQDFIDSVAFSHDSKFVISGSNDKTIKIWDSMTGKCQQTLHGHLKRVNAVVFSHDSKFIASGSQDGTIKLWDSVTGKCQQTLDNCEARIYSVAFSHDSKFLVSGSEGGIIKIWDTSIWFSHRVGNQEDGKCPELTTRREGKETKKHGSASSTKDVWVGNSRGRWR